ncbi:SDR family oxidoreductase [Microvirga pudoricolor]|uniref:SDR family oxidoreductase n=1 Tax=Microvirga pudoricolor TaxID=2778729 RepID=UPI00194E1F23|nr:SDR family oxidoreductase [Microvirga pudoricolor]MBM6596647.1 SDR family oxidoreductase [Microvirga pudoricolor]
MSGSLLIVGAGPGIGEATALRFGRSGWTVTVASRSPRTIDPLVARLVGNGVAAHGLVIDATNPLALRAGVRTADRMSGGLTTVLYNAANVRRQDLFSMSDAEIEADLAVNVAGALHTIRAAVGLFEDQGGTILVTGGGLALEPQPDYASLGLGKAALRNVVEGLASPLKTRGIRLRMATVATLVHPGSAEAAEVAEVMWALATDPETGWERAYPTVPLSKVLPGSARAASREV